MGWGDADAPLTVPQGRTFLFFLSSQLQAMHRLKPEKSSPSGDTNPHRSIGGRRARKVDTLIITPHVTLFACGVVGGNQCGNWW